MCIEYSVLFFNISHLLQKAHFKQLLTSPFFPASSICKMFIIMRFHPIGRSPLLSQAKQGTPATQIIFLCKNILIIIVITTFTCNAS